MKPEYALKKNKEWKNLIPETESCEQAEKRFAFTPRLVKEIQHNAVLLKDYFGSMNKNKSLPL